MYAKKSKTNKSRGNDGDALYASQCWCIHKSSCSEESSPPFGLVCAGEIAESVCALRRKREKKGLELGRAARLAGWLALCSWRLKKSRREKKHVPMCAFGVWWIDFAQMEWNEMK